MRKALLILVAVALLGVAAAYVDPVGNKSSGSKVAVTKVSTVAPAVSVSTASSTQQTAAAYKDGTYQGDDYSSQYGDVQVSVTVQGGKIAGVALDQLTSFDQHSDEINNSAAPLLKSQTLAAQSAHIDGVSGASFTSASYEQSLQSALDKARA